MNNVTIGMDLGDKNNAVCILNGLGKVVNQTMIVNSSDDLKKFFLNPAVNIFSDYH